MASHVSNIAGKAYAMNVLTPMRPGRTWLNRLLLMVARVTPSTLAGLLGLSLIMLLSGHAGASPDWQE